MLLSGAGQKDSEGRSNFKVVSPDTDRGDILKSFNEFTARNDISVVFINIFAANKIRDILNVYKSIKPVVMEIPARDESFDMK